MMLVATVLIMCRSADAAQLPKQFFGTWCLGPEDRHVLIEGTPNCRADEEEMIFTRNGYDGPEYSCRYVAIQTWRDRNLPYSTKEMGAPTAKIDARCEGEGCQWRERLVIRFPKEP
jgi:hypothetical protein